MITVREAQTAYTTGHRMGVNPQPVTAYALGGCHQGNGLTNDVFAMQRRTQFGAICCVVAAVLAGVVSNTSSFEAALGNNNTHALEVALTETFKGITRGQRNRLIAIIRTCDDGFKKLMTKDEEDPQILAALKADEDLWGFLKRFETNEQ